MYGKNITYESNFPTRDENPPESIVPKTQFCPYFREGSGTHVYSQDRCSLKMLKKLLPFPSRWKQLTIKLLLILITVQLLTNFKIL